MHWLVKTLARPPAFDQDIWHDLLLLIFTHCTCSIQLETIIPAFENGMITDAYSNTKLSILADDLMNVESLIRAITMVRSILHIQHVRVGLSQYNR